MGILSRSLFELRWADEAVGTYPAVDAGSFELVYEPDYCQGQILVTYTTLGGWTAEESGVIVAKRLDDEWVPVTSRLFEALSDHFEDVVREGRIPITLV